MKTLHMSEGLIRHDYNPARPYVAIASMDGKNIDQPLGQALSLFIYRADAPSPKLVEQRDIPLPGKGLGRWMALGNILSDCGWLLVPGIGEAAFKILVNKGIMVYIIEGSIDGALGLILTNGNLNTMARPDVLARPATRARKSGIRCTSGACGGGGRGCYES
ncbi:NifB/NifX family molybdenum-iron cluster-binding protein [Desulfobacter sp.]|uniref:NifB/NifX family molybdenum-iron cluster-binding protein n=1 Tax=Desulfobacter sp. TaxID=2294 RepID=UPI003D0FFD3E